MQVGLVHDFAHLPQWFILLLQQGVLAKEMVFIDNKIIVTMKRNFFMILIFLRCLIIKMPV
jgi:hypothetical protein